MRVRSGRGSVKQLAVSVLAAAALVAGAGVVSATTAAASPGVPVGAPTVRGDVARFANSDVRGMIAYSMLLAKTVKYHSAYKIPARWKLKSLKFFEADGCPSVKDSPENGCIGKQAKSASGFHRWIVSIAVVWQTPRKQIVANVRAPLTETLNDPTQWIFTVKTESGADVYVGVNDKTGVVAPVTGTPATWMPSWWTCLFLGICPK